MLKILLVEDNLEHAKLIELILRRKKVPVQVSIARDGSEALERFRALSHRVDWNKTPQPDLILLDLNTPRLDGRDLLHHLKTARALRNVPVVVISTSNRPEDRLFAEREGAAQYICKSGSFEEWSQKLVASARRIAREK